MTFSSGQSLLDTWSMQVLNFLFMFEVDDADIHIYLPPESFR